MAAAVTIDDMREKLLTVDEVRERFAATEPLSQQEFPMRGGSKVVARFDLDPGWNAGVESLEGTDPVDGTVKIGSTEFRLTKDALLEATSHIGITKQYVMKTPANLIVPHLNYWYKNTDKDMKVLAREDLALAFTKGTIDPFSNIRLMDQAIEAAQERYGANTEVLVDYKFKHDLRQTALRLIIPESERAVRPGDTWSAGISIKNSLVGESATALNGYLFRYWCTNGATSTHAQSGNWNRRTGGQGGEVYDWARSAVDDILGGLDHEFEALDELANAAIPEEDFAQTIEDAFTTYRVPVAARAGIIENAVNADDLTLYGLMQAITQAANDPNITEAIRETLLQIGGDMPRANAERCAACRRITPA